MLSGKLEEIPTGFNVVIDLKNNPLGTSLANENLNHFKHDYGAAWWKCTNHRLTITNDCPNIVEWNEEEKLSHLMNEIRIT
ncbi:MAG: hypothetical protein IPL23_09100 [Saprospiraceae bacterium]|nr:hypothetical protein [Saprospiraceae bacterium]